MGKTVSRYAKKTDSNQREIIDAFKKAGADVVDLSAVGKGVPDLLVSTLREMWLVEVKVENKKLNERQVKWWTNWLGKPPVIIRTPKAAIQLVRNTIV